MENSQIEVRNFKSVEEIKAAVDAGKIVHWGNDGYIVQKNFASYDVVFTSNQHCVGLTWKDGKTCDYEMKDFYYLIPSLTPEQIERAEQHYIDHEPQGMFMEAQIADFATQKLGIVGCEINDYIDTVIENGFSPEDQTKFLEFYFCTVMTEEDRTTPHIDMREAFVSGRNEQAGNIQVGNIDLENTDLYIDGNLVARRNKISEEVTIFRPEDYKTFRNPLTC